MGPRRWRARSLRESLTESPTINAPVRMALAMAMPAMTARLARRKWESVRSKSFSRVISMSPTFNFQSKEPSPCPLPAYRERVIHASVAAFSLAYELAVGHVELMGEEGR